MAHAVLATFVTGPFVWRRLYHDSEGTIPLRQEIRLRSPLRVSSRGGRSFIVPPGQIHFNERQMLPEPRM